MQGFRIFFPVKVTGPEVKEFVESSGIQADAFELSGEFQVHMSQGEARLYATVDNREQIPKEDLDDRNNWPLPFEQVQSLMYIEKKLGDTSFVLAMRVAHLLEMRFGGKVSWDAFEDGRARYEHLVKTKQLP
jgi:hypothetical protein